jgi:hypothetical protein
VRLAETFAPSELDSVADCEVPAVRLYDVPLVVEREVDWLCVRPSAKLSVSELPSLLDRSSRTSSVSPISLETYSRVILDAEKHLHARIR